LSAVFCIYIPNTTFLCEQDIFGQAITDITAVRLKVEENQLVDVFGEIGFHVDGLKGA
jgi:hypothetical protein